MFDGDAMQMRRRRAFARGHEFIDRCRRVSR
jgi:hypothetical protein